MKQLDDTQKGDQENEHNVRVKNRRKRQRDQDELTFENESKKVRFSKVRRLLKF